NRYSESPSGSGSRASWTSGQHGPPLTVGRSRWTRGHAVAGARVPAHRGARRQLRQDEQSMSMGALPHPRPPGTHPEGSTMTTYKVGYFVGSLSSTSVNRELAKALIRMAP